MNKNTIIALVLSLGILMGWQYYMKKNSGQATNDTAAPAFHGLKKVTPDYKNRVLQLSWDHAEDESTVSYVIFMSEGSKITSYSNPVDYTRENSYIISDLDISKNHYFAVRAVDAANNAEKNTRQIKFTSTFKDKSERERIVTYENELATFQFSSIGGRLKNVILKKYNTLDTQKPVELLNYMHKADKYSYPLDVKILGNNDNPDLVKYNDQVNYSVKKYRNTIEFSSMNSQGVKIEKIYSMNKDQYYFDLKIRLKATGAKKNIDHLYVKWQPTLGPVNTMDKYDKIANSYYAAGKLENASYKKKNLGKLQTERAENVEWVAFHNRYFLAAILPVEKYKVDSVVFFSDGKKNIGGLNSEIDADKLRTQDQEFNYQVYVGPKLRDTFRSVKSLETLEKATTSRGFLGLGKLSNFLAKYFLNALLFIFGLVKSYGLAIIIFTVIIKIILYPLTHKQFESMVKMQKIQPVITQVREQYKKDPQMMNKELMKVYKKYKVNPFGGCLPLIPDAYLFCHLEYASIGH
jgi:YidC/Oxa1 family membrane protein insertase